MFSFLLLLFVLCPLVLFGCSAYRVTISLYCCCPVQVGGGGGGAQKDSRCTTTVVYYSSYSLVIEDYPACDVGAQFTFLQLALLLCFALVWARIVLLCCLLAPRSAACARHEADAQQHTHSTVRVVPTFYTGARSYTDSISNVFFFCFFSWRYWREGQTNTQNIPKRRDSVVVFLSVFLSFLFRCCCWIILVVVLQWWWGEEKSLWHGWKCK